MIYKIQIVAQYMPDKPIHHNIKPLAFIICCKVKYLRK